jgi:CRP-like cAMP-binding protein
MISGSLLQGVYLFKDMTADERARFAKLAEVVSVAPGGRVFRAGEGATAMFLVKDGSVQINAATDSGGTVNVATLASGAHFGEMGLVDDQPRSASAEALELTHLFKFDYSKMQALLASDAAMSDKFFRALSHFLCNRLRQTTSDMTFAREKNLRHF